MSITIVPNLTLYKLKTLLHYNADTGLFTRKVKSRCPIGSVAGRKHSNGYVLICVSGINYWAHRLAWLYSYGSWPVNEIDHINGIHDDNRLCNIRDVTSKENKQNQRKAKGYCKHQSRWRSYIKTDGRTKYLGTFRTEQEARQAYLNAKKIMHPSAPINWFQATHDTIETLGGDQ